MTDPFIATVRRAGEGLRLHADAAAAPVRKRYLKSPFEVLGCGVPVVSAAARAVRREHPRPDPDTLIRALEELWRSHVHDDRLLAILLAALYHPLLDAGHVAGILRVWLEDSHTWDHVDGIATRVVGQVALGHPEAWREIGTWAYDPWMWLRRASVLAHIPAIRRGALERALFKSTCERLVEEPEFFIRKALGWALRELSTKDVEIAEGIVLALGARVSGITLREATRRMSPKRRERIRDALGRERSPG